MTEAALLPNVLLAIRKRDDGIVSPFLENTVESGGGANLESRTKTI